VFTSPTFDGIMLLQQKESWMFAPLHLTPAPQADLWGAKLMSLLDSTGEGMFGIDLDGRCIFINRAAAEMLGHSVASVLGQNMHALIHHKHADGHTYPEQDCPIFLAFRTGQACRIDHEVFWRADGSSFATEYSSHQIVDQGVVTGAVITFSDISKRRRAEIALQKAKEELEQRVLERTEALSAALEQLRELSAHTHSVLEEERKRIAREIHDELGSLLVALKMDVNWVARRVQDKAELIDKCKTMNRLIESAVDDVGRIITDLRPSILDHQGLIAALEWHAQEFADTVEMICSIQIQSEPDAPAPEASLATAAFRIFQEMLSNVARHSEASVVRIQVKLTATTLSMEVEDNGKGSSAQALNHIKSYGVMGMRERALHFGGTLDIKSQPGQGTLVRLLMPLSQHVGTTIEHNVQGDPT
jgi:PAS domain S-box-containing protein